RLRLLGGAAGAAQVARDVRTDRVGLVVPRDPVAGGVLRVEARTPRVLRVGARRAGEGTIRRRHLRDPSGRDQHAAVRPGTAEDRPATATGSADLPAGA